MAGSGIDDDWDLSESSNEVRTLVLVGKAGNGKSATGNTILGKKAFNSGMSCSGVTVTCEMQSTVLRDGQVIKVIDTPGLFDFSAEAEVVGKEIVDCILLAKDGIHAVLVVFSVRTRITKEEEAVIQNLKTLFGEKILDYMIFVFTGGDDMERVGMSLEDYVGSMCPKPIQEIFRLCKNRLVLFNNVTCDEMKKAEQVQKMLGLVNLVVSENDGNPFSDEFFVELKKGAAKLDDRKNQMESLEGHSKQEILELKDTIYKSYENQLKTLTQMIEQRFKETIEQLEKRMDEEKAARLQAEEASQEEIRQLRDSLKEAQDALNAKANKCTIL